MKKRIITLSAALLACALLSYLLGWWGERYRVAVGMSLADCVDAAARVMEPHSTSIDFGAAYWYGEENQPLDVVVASIHSEGSPQMLLLVATRPMPARWAEGKLHLDMEDNSWKVAQLIVCPQQQEDATNGIYWQRQLQGAEYPEALTRCKLRGLCE